MGTAMHPGLVVAESAHHGTGGPTSTALRISACTISNTAPQTLHWSVTCCCSGTATIDPPQSTPGLAMRNDRRLKRFVSGHKFQWWRGKISFEMETAHDPITGRAIL